MNSLSAIGFSFVPNTTTFDPAQIVGLGNDSRLVNAIQDVLSAKTPAELGEAL